MARSRAGGSSRAPIAYVVSAIQKFSLRNFSTFVTHSSNLDIITSVASVLFFAFQEMFVKPMSFLFFLELMHANNLCIYLDAHFYIFWNDGFKT